MAVQGEDDVNVAEKLHVLEVINPEGVSRRHPLPPRPVMERFVVVAWPNTAEPNNPTPFVWFSVELTVNPPPTPSPPRIVEVVLEAET